MWKIAIPALIGVALGVLTAILVLPRPDAAVRTSGGVVTTGKALVGGPFSLVDHTGKPVTDRDFRGRYLLVFFGFTHCPDVCPAALQTVTAALGMLGAKANRVTPIFITLDPERDTPEKLSEYVKSFDARVVGLTGSLDQVHAVAKAYRVVFKKSESARGGNDYTLDHTSIIYLMDPNGEFVAPLSQARGAAEIAERLQEIL